MQRAKWTRKKSYTLFLTDQARTKFWLAGLDDSYLNLPRKSKKRWKTWARKAFYYTKLKGVTVFNPYLLSYPVPESILNMFGKDTIPLTSSETCTFRRFNTIARAE